MMEEIPDFCAVQYLLIGRHEVPSVLPVFITRFILHFVTQLYHICDFGGISNGEYP